MGVYSELYIDFIENYPQLIEGTEKFDFMFDMFIALKTTDGVKPNPLIAEFFKDVFCELHGGDILWTMASAGGYSYNFSFSTLDEALKGFTALLNYDVNLYYSPAIFKGWRKDKNVSRINVIYIDIDDVEGVDFSEMDEKGIKDYLYCTYHLTSAMFPNWLVSSGHGLHLYYIVNTLDLKNEADSKLRALYTDYLITHFRADIACRNKSRVLRFPLSRNVKNMEAIKTTRLFHLNPSTDIDIKRLDCFRHPQSEIDAYIKACNLIRAEKRKQTMIKNGTWKTKAIKIKVADKRSTPIPIQTTAKTVSAINKSKIDIQPDSATSKTGVHPELKINTFPMPTKSRYKRILRDLHNYAARRKGCPKGHRAIYTHITAIFLKRILVPEEAAVERVKQYIDRDFFDEAEEIVRNAYASKTQYMYTNARIAALLDFQEYDIKNSFSAYTVEQKQAARVKSVKSYDAKRYAENRANIQEKRQQRYEYVKSHMDFTAASLAEELGCSIRTIKSVKAVIRQQEKG